MRQAAPVVTNRDGNVSICQLALNGHFFCAGLGTAMHSVRCTLCGIELIIHCCSGTTGQQFYWHAFFRC